MADWGAFYKFCIKNKAQPNSHLRTVYRVFQDCLINIGEITCDNPNNMRDLFRSEVFNGKDEEERGNNFI
jgi:hypothetical protein